MESNYPPGAENDSRAPWLQKDDEYSTPQGAEEPYKALFYNKEICILRDITNNTLWVFYNNNSSDTYRQYASVGPDGYVDVTKEVIARYVNDNLGLIKRGEGIQAWEDGVELVKIDNELSALLRATYKEERLKNILLALS